MECFPSPCFRSLRGAKRRSNLVAPRLTSQARQDCFAALAMTRLKCDQSPFPLPGENRECFPSPCSLSLRGAKRRSNLVAPRLTSQARQDCFATLAMTRLKCNQAPFPSTGENMECFPSPCSLSLRGAKRRSNLVALALASQARRDCFAALAMTRLKCDQAPSPSPCPSPAKGEGTY